MKATTLFANEIGEREIETERGMSRRMWTIDCCGKKCLLFQKEAYAIIHS